MFAAFADPILEEYKMNVETMIFLTNVKADQLAETHKFMEEIGVETTNVEIVKLCNPEEPAEFTIYGRVVSAGKYMAYLEDPSLFEKNYKILFTKSEPTTVESTPGEN